jgi:maleylpyruvate isomerase
MDEAVARALDAQVTGCAASHQRLLTSLESLTDEQCRQPSLLPGWTRGHVLSHLARNAESHARMFAAATRGDESEQYPGGKQVRDAAIESGSTRSAAELVTDVRVTIYSLEAAWAGATATTWSGHGIKSHSDGARVGISDLVLMRWCETEVHHADLDLGFTWRDWNPLFVRYDLDRRVMAWRARKPMGLTTLPDAVLKLNPNERLAWLYNRTTVAGVPSVEPY